MVSIDALDCQKKIAEKIIFRERDYFFQVKGNQSSFKQKTSELFNSLPPIPQDTKTFTLATFTTTSESDERVETRKCIVIKKRPGESLGDNIFNEWPSLHKLIRIESEVNKVLEETSQKKTRHFVSSHRDFSGEEALSYARKHWEIEDKLHWSLDVTSCEDDKRNRQGNSANNCAILRKMTFNLLQIDPSDKTLPLKQQRAASDNTFLLELLVRNSIKSHKKHKKQ